SELSTAGAAGLGGLVLVVGKGQVYTAAVDLEADAEQRLSHRRALDVPAGASKPPRGGPGDVLAGLLGLPEGEIECVGLALGALELFALVHLLDVATRESTVVGI